MTTHHRPILIKQILRGVLPAGALALLLASCGPLGVTSGSVSMSVGTPGYYLTPSAAWYNNPLYDGIFTGSPAATPPPPQPHHYAGNPWGPGTQIPGNAPGIPGNGNPGGNPAPGPGNGPGNGAANPMQSPGRP